MPRVRLGHRALREACEPQCPPSQDPRHPAFAGPLAPPRLAALPRPLVRSMPLAVARMRASGRCRFSGWGRVSGSLCVSFKCVDFPGYYVFRWGFVFRLVVFVFRWCRGCAAVSKAGAAIVAFSRAGVCDFGVFLCFGWYLCFGGAAAVLLSPRPVLP